MIYFNIQTFTCLICTSFLPEGLADRAIPMNVMEYDIQADIGRDEEVTSENTSHLHKDEHFESSTNQHVLGSETKAASTLTNESAEHSSAGNDRNPMEDIVSSQLQLKMLCLPPKEKEDVIKREVIADILLQQLCNIQKQMEVTNTTTMDDSVFEMALQYPLKFQWPFDTSKVEEVIADISSIYLTEDRQPFPTPKGPVKPTLEDTLYNMVASVQPILSVEANLDLQFAIYLSQEQDILKSFQAFDKLHQDAYGSGSLEKLGQCLVEDHMEWLKMLDKSFTAFMSLKWQEVKSIQTCLHYIVAPLWNLSDRSEAFCICICQLGLLHKISVEVPLLYHHDSSTDNITFKV